MSLLDPMCVRCGARIPGELDPDDMSPVCATCWFEDWVDDDK